MKLLSCLFPALILLSTTAWAQNSAIEFNTPPAWRGESIPLPPGFAKDLKWNGVEHIRFAPGMFDPESESFFSYVLVFLLSETDDVSEEAVHEQILTYYRGLASAVMASKGMTVDATKFQLKLETVDGEPQSVPAAAKSQEVKDWVGILEWTEPFATQKPQALTIEVHLWKNGKKPVLYFTVSPQSSEHAIWKEMRGFRAAFGLGE